MSEFILHGQRRTEKGKQTKNLRKMGSIPGILYKQGTDTIPITVNELALRPLFTASSASLIDFNLEDGSKHLCILRDVEFDPLTDRPVHFDLMGLREDQSITMNIPVTVKGTPKGVKDGGTLQVIMHKLKVSCLPKNIPSQIELDVTDLAINKSFHVRDIKIPNVELLDDEASTVVIVLPPTIVKEETPGTAPAAEAPAEPEVIAKGKKPEEGEEE